LHNGFSLCFYRYEKTSIEKNLAPIQKLVAFLLFKSLKHRFFQKMPVGRYFCVVAFLVYTKCVAFSFRYITLVDVFSLKACLLLDVDSWEVWLDALLTWGSNRLGLTNFYYGSFLAHYKFSGLGLLLYLKVLSSHPVQPSLVY